MFSIVPRGAKFDVGSIAMQSGNFRNKASRQGLESTSLEGAEILQPVAATAHHGVLARLGLRGDGRHACWGLKAPSAVGWISAVPSVPFRSGAHQGCGAARQVCYSRAGTVLRFFAGSQPCAICAATLRLLLSHLLVFISVKEL